MPTIITHAVLPLAAGIILRAPKRLLVISMFAAMLPDLDVLAFKLGIDYAHQLGHRGFSHSLLFAALFASLLCIFSRWFKAPRSLVFILIFCATASHGLLDMLTNGGLGVAYFWPFSHERFFLPIHPIQVSPLSIQRILSNAGLKVVYSELLWVWLPCSLLLSICWLNRFITAKRLRHC